MKYFLGQSQNNDAKACVDEATRQFQNPKMIIYYSSIDGFLEYTQLLHEKFPNSICMGASTYVCLTKTGAIKKGLTAVAIEAGISCSAGVLEQADTCPVKYADSVKACVEKVRNQKNTICLEFTTALCCAEESVLAVLNSVLLDYHIPLVGGSAGDDTSGKATYVALNGTVYENSCVFALLHNESGAVRWYRENIYKPKTGNLLTATKVDWVNREVKEYNHEPAAKVYARELGVAESEISKYFDSYPMGRVFGKEMYITANCAETPGKGMKYHARVYDNSRVYVLEPDDYRSVVKKTMEQIKAEVPNPSFCIMCHCLARSLLFEGEGYLQEYCKTMGGVLGDYIGFSGYGEQMNRQQFNQTMTVIVFE